MHASPFTSDTFFELKCAGVLDRGPGPQSRVLLWWTGIFAVHSESARVGLRCWTWGTNLI